MIDIPSLDELGLTNGTDKASWGHNYLVFYESYLAPRRLEALNILEIGVAGGASLKTWSDYFPQAKILGADINPDTKKYERGRIAIHLVDQSSQTQLLDLGKSQGPFDLIVDDGSHIWSHQILTLQTLFPFLSPRGIYIIEDLQTSYGAFSKSFGTDSAISCVDYLKLLLDLKVGGDLCEVTLASDDFLARYPQSIEFIAFHKHACLIQNGCRGRVEASIIRHDGLVGRSDLELRTHIGRYGDRLTRNGLVSGRAGTQNIQGFSLKAIDSALPRLEYRARLADGRWTDWVGEGIFVGSRGKSQDLTGLAVRCKDSSLSEANVLVVGGRFVGLEEPVVVAGGKDCIPLQPGGALWAFQVSVST